MLQKEPLFPLFPALSDLGKRKLAMGSLLCEPVAGLEVGGTLHFLRRSSGSLLDSYTDGFRHCPRGRARLSETGPDAARQCP